MPYVLPLANVAHLLRVRVMGRHMPYVLPLANVAHLLRVRVMGRHGRWTGGLSAVSDSGAVSSWSMSEKITPVIADRSEGSVGGEGKDRDRYSDMGRDRDEDRDMDIWTLGHLDTRTPGHLDTRTHRYLDI